MFELDIGLIIQCIILLMLLGWNQWIRLQCTNHGNCCKSENTNVVKMETHKNKSVDNTKLMSQLLTSILAAHQIKCARGYQPIENSTSAAFSNNKHVAEKIVSRPFKRDTRQDESVINEQNDTKPECCMLISEDMFE